ncbi:MAG TPA: hypothetical protein DD473_01690, partial [Planctomycetaceae bacterium]|nr:hypothetical protein [Planctomycetaceae bacterium]
MELLSRIGGKENRLQDYNNLKSRGSSEYVDLQFKRKSLKLAFNRLARIQPLFKRHASSISRKLISMNMMSWDSIRKRFLLDFNGFHTGPQFRNHFHCTTVRTFFLVICDQKVAGNSDESQQAEHHE